MINDKWKIKLSTKLSKSITELPENVRSKFLALFKALEEKGAIQYD
jgi:mRNA-degrading endonuclease RelE of RelBE toxin-antitoxin system